MSASNNRIKEYDTYHHLMSRIAHKVYFMTEEVRNDFIEMIRRAAEFCGIELVAWCIMTNHFHILAYLPEPTPLSEEEIVRRYGVLKGDSRRMRLESELARYRANEKDGESKVKERLAKITSAMFNIGEFMKIVKQWMTQEYNQRTRHTGTLWEAVYKDVPIEAKSARLAQCAAYIHLNPIRAGIEYGFDKYLWSSFTALKRGDEIALSGMRKIYGEWTREEIISGHEELLAKTLEQIKFDRAVEIARRRAAGFEMEADPLTSEALIAQAKAHIERVVEASVEGKVLSKTRGRPSTAAELESRIRSLLAANPKMSAAAVVEATGRSKSAVYQVLKKLKGEGGK